MQISTFLVFVLVHLGTASAICDPQAPPDSCDGIFKPAICDTDGVTLITCAGCVKHSQKCSSLFPNQPCCVDDRCVAETAGLQCSAAVNGAYTCTSMDYFPDPNDCNKYYICSEPGGDSISYPCPPLYVFDPRTDQCRRKQTVYDCVTINCGGQNKNKYVLHPRDRSIMAFCSDTGTSQETILYRCPDHTNMQFDLNTFQCTFVCRQEGRFPDQEDCRGFYECYWNNRVLTARKQSCPLDYIYNATTKLCVVDFDGTCQSFIAERQALIRTLFFGNHTVP